MMGFFPDLAANDAIDRAESDPEQAAEVLRLAAAYMRRGEALPYNLADYLAGAIEASMGKPERHRGGALLEELHLKARNCRPAAYWGEVGKFMDDEISEAEKQIAALYSDKPYVPSRRAVSLNQAATAAAVKFGIAESTAARYYKRYADAIEEDRRIIEEEMRVELENEECEEALGQAENAIRQEEAEREKVSQKPPTF